MDLEFQEIQLYDNIGYMIYKDKKYIGRLKSEKNGWVYYPTNEFGIGSTSLSINEMHQIIEFLKSTYSFCI
jgi:phage pi2 protein 07